MIFSLFLLLFFFILFIIGTILFIRLPFVQINKVNIIGTDNIPINEIKDSTFEYLEGKYLGIIPKSSIIFFPKKTISNNLLNKYKIINNLSISRDGLSEITVNITNRVPSAIVCDGFRGDNIPHDCFLSDKKGYIYNRASIEDIDNNNYNKYFFPNSSESLKEGTVFIDEILFGKLQGFISGSIQNGLLPLGILVGTNGEYEMYVENVFVKEGITTDITIYFDNKTPFETTLSNLITFWKDALEKNRNANAPIFDSINLHFGNTIYYSKQDNNE